MNIREYQAKDATYLFKINTLCFTYPESNIGLLKNIHNGQTWVYINEQDIPIGFLISLWQDGPHVYNLAVHPDFRNKNVATSLMEQFHYFYREQDSTHLRVDCSNYGALKLYLNMNYKVHHIQYDYYGKGKDALYMVRSQRSEDNPK